MPDLRLIYDLHHSLWQCQILNTLSEARDWTCILMDAGQIRFCWATMGIPDWLFFFWCSNSWNQLTETKLINNGYIYQISLNQFMITFAFQVNRFLLFIIKTILPWWLNGLKIQCFHWCGLGCCCSMGSVPGPGISTWLRRGKNKQANKQLQPLLLPWCQHTTKMLESCSANCKWVNLKGNSSFCRINLAFLVFFFFLYFFFFFLLYLFFFPFLSFPPCRHKINFFFFFFVFFFF